MTLPVNQIVCGDCLELMAEIPDKAIDLVLTDPPYGIGMHRQIGLKKGETGNKWDKFSTHKWDDLPPDKTYFDRIIKISTNQIIWGGNYFGLPATRCFLIWDKINRCDYTDCEMAWTSYDTSARIFTYGRGNMQGFRYPERTHPTEKPIVLMKWCLENYSKPNDLILDPFCGSGTTCLAAKMLGRRWIGIDISPEYCHIAEERLKAYDDCVPVKEKRKGQESLFKT